MIIKNKKIPTMPINKTQKRLYAGSSDPTFEHDTLNSMQEYLNNPTAYMGQMLYCKENDKHYSISKNDQDEKILKEIGSDQSGNLKIVETLDDRDALEDVTYGLMCYVIEEGVYFSYRRGLEEEDEKDGWEPFKGSGGGGTSIGTLTSSYDEKSLAISVGQSLEVDLFFSTPNVGAGTLYITSNNNVLQKKSIKMGSHKIQLTLDKGEHTIQIYAVDRAGVYTNIVQFTVQCGGLEISTDFNWDDTYKVGIPINIQYKIDTISTEDIIVNFKIGNRTFQQTTKNKHNVFKLPTDFSAGAHKVEIWATSGTLKSNQIVAELVILNSDSLFVSTMFDKTEAEEGDQLIINYRVSMEGVKDFDVVYIVNEEEHSTGKAINGSNMFAISTLPIKEDNVIKIQVTAPNGQTFTLPIHIKIIESTYKVQTPVIDDTLLFYVDAYEHSNQSQDKGVWRDKITDEVIGELYNFNYGTNGWMDNGLKMNGNAYVKINKKPFENNAPDGLTIDIEFKTEDIGNEDARVMDCTTRLGTGLGCFIDTGKANLKSQKGEASSPFAQNEKTRVTYVIDRANKITKLYINAVMSAVWKLTDIGTGAHKQLESFQHDDFIYLNSTRGTTNFGDCTVYSVRVYSRALESEEVLRNFIADIRDKDKQKAKYDFNYKDTIPTMTFVCDPAKFKEMSKKDPVTMQIKYVSTNQSLYGQSFDLPNCEVKWQGTSSIVYDVKNYKIKLKDEKGEKHKHALREDMIKESTFVLKADYMESSHANNTGLAKIVNKYLYAEDKKLPPQEKNDKVVSAIDGFPIKLYLNNELMGVFNFNLDKGNDKSFGFSDKNPDCISYEISANTDTTAGAFFKYDEYKKKYSDWETKYPTELDYLKSSFEQRFPDEDDEGKANYGYIDKLKPLVDWVSDASDDEFRENFDNHFDREYTFKYYLFVLIMGMVDNLGKNMMLCTWDGAKWYPCFYDLDTCLSLNNTGFIKFDVDIEIEPEIYNTSGSRLWTKVGRVFEEELKEMYVEMRKNKFKEKNIFDILIGEQIDQIPERLYNEDSQKKYIDHPEYLSMLHGSRREHMKKWITERLLYLDSKFGYEPTTGDAIIIRANKQGTATFKIKTYSPMYIKIKWSNEAGGTQLQKVGRNTTVSFSYNIATNTDQEINIYSAQHLKEIGDISAMNPSSLILGNATKLTKLICKKSTSLSSIGLGGQTNGVDKRMKNLQEVDLTNCSKLGTTDTSRSLDVSYCDNLKTLKAQGTNLQNIQFNPAGGNLEELYLPNSMTSLYLTNQYNLRKIEFPSYAQSGRLTMRYTYNEGSKITDLTLINCPKLTSFGSSTSFDSGIKNYRGGNISNQSSDFDITWDEYTNAFKAACFGRLETIQISNSLLDHSYYNINCSPSLSTISFTNMPNLKGLILTGNRAYGGTGGNSSENIEKEPRFENITVSECPNFKDLILQYAYGDAVAFKFKKDFEWDLSSLKLERFICNIALQDLKKLILPNTIKEFSHSRTTLRDNSSVWDAPDGSRSGYYANMSPLETIVIDGHYIEDFNGIDLGNVELKNVNLNGLTQKVNIIKNIVCEAIDLLPRMSQCTGQTFDSITLNLDNYRETSFNSFFKNTDMTNINVVLNEQLTAENLDYENMFYQAKNMSWDKIQWIKKLPKGRVYQTFFKCEADRLEVGHMIGNTTSSLENCFYQLPNITYLDVTGADTSAVTNMRRAFSGNKKLEQIIGIETLDFSNVTNAYEFLCDNSVLTNVPVQIMGKFTSVSELNRFFLATPLCGTDNPIKIPDSVVTMTDLIGEQWGEPIIDTLTFEFGEASKLKRIETIGHMQYPIKHIKFVNMPPVDTCNYLLQGNGGSKTTIQSITGINASMMTNICRPLAYVWSIGYFTYPSFKSLTFEGDISCSELYIANLHYLEAECLAQIIRQLKNKNDETSGVLTIGKHNMEKLTQDQIEMAQSKNWSVVS